MNAYIKQDFGDEVIYHFEDRELGEWFDNERKKILKELSGIYNEVGIGELEFPKRNYN